MRRILKRSFTKCQLKNSGTALYYTVFSKISEHIFYELKIMASLTTSRTWLFYYKTYSVNLACRCGGNSVAFSLNK